MADQVTITNLPDSGSPARVAYDLMKAIRFSNTGSYMTEADMLDLYARCLHAAQGYREVKMKG